MGARTSDVGSASGSMLRTAGHNDLHTPDNPSLLIAADYITVSAIEAKCAVPSQLPVLERCRRWRPA